MDFLLPELGEGVYEGEFVRWLVQEGDTVKRGQPLLEVMTDKATMEVPSPFAGTITSLKLKPDQKVKVGEPVLSYSPSGAPVEAPAPVTVPAKTAALAAVPRSTLANGPPRSGVPSKASPSVRQLARKLGLDLNTLQGSGPDGRILLEDLAPRITSSTAPVPQPSAPKPDYGRPGTRIKMQGVRRKIAERMVQSKRTIPHYSYVDECDVTELVRDQLKDRYARKGVKLTYLAFFVKALVAALKEVPIVNATLDEEGREIVLHDRYSIGVAVATQAGLIVPVVKEADHKTVGDIAREIERLSQEAREGKLRRDDLVGGTFTITSVGNIGGLISTPVINHPEVAILGLGKIVKRPVYDESGAIKPADLIYLSFSFDHRVVDGAVAAAFANVLLRELQTPAALLVDL